MNSKAEAGDLLTGNIIYIVLLVLFFSGMLWFVLSYKGGAALWEDYYAKEIVKIADFAEAEDEFIIDVHSATRIAKRNKLSSFSEIFEINNEENEVCVKLSRGRKTCYSYFNDLDLIVDLKLAEKTNVDGDIVNVLNIKFRDSGGSENVE